MNKQWAIFYTAPNGETFACNTHLGLAQLSYDAINVYCDETRLNEIYEQTIAYVRRDKRPADASGGNAYWEGCLKPEYRNGKVFISRVGSKDFPAKLLKEPKFQQEFGSDGKGYGPLLWALRVPCKLN